MKEDTPKEEDNTVTKKESISHHIFLCPLDLGEVKFDSIKLKRGSNDWSEFKFEINTPEDYSEQEYFYRFASAAMFDVDGPVKRFRHNLFSKLDEESKNSKYKDSKYDFHFCEKKYSLDIEDVIINIYETGIAILSFHLDNKEYSRLEDIKIINDVGRRIFPQFLARDDKDWTKFPKSKFVPEYLRLTNKENKVITSFFDDFSSKEKLQNRLTTYKGEPDFRIPSIIRELFNGLDINEAKLNLLVDDRMFVLSWIGNNTFSQKIAKKVENYTDSEEWHNLLFCDIEANANHDNDSIRHELNKAHTYDRWLGQGTLYGVTRYSFILLTNSEWFPTHVLKGHFTTMYFQMVQLCLVQRASILKYSSNASRLASKIKTSINNREQKELTHLQINFVRFINRLYFREVTPQEQGIDLYNMLHKHMRIPQQLKELDSEINEMVQLQNLMQNQEDSKLLKQLTIIATIFLIPSLIVGLLGMNVINLDSFQSNGIGLIIYSLLAIVTFIISVYAIQQIYGNIKKETNLNKLQLNVIMIMLFTVLILGTIGVLLKQLA